MKDDIVSELADNIREQEPSHQECQGEGKSLRSLVNLHIHVKRVVSLSRFNFLQLITIKIGLVDPIPGEVGECDAEEAANYKRCQVDPLLICVATQLISLNTQVDADGEVGLQTGS